MTNSFFFILSFFFISYNLRIIQEYFQPKIGRKIRIFSLGRKNNILIKKRVYTVPKLRIYHSEIDRHTENFDQCAICCLHFLISGYRVELCFDQSRLLSIFVNLELITCRRTVTMFKVPTFIQQKPSEMCKFLT